MTEQERQNVRDLLEAARRVGGDELKQSVWEQIPYKTRFEFNWEKHSGKEPISRA